MKRRTFVQTLATTSTAAALGADPREAVARGVAKPTRITLLGTGTPTPSLGRQGLRIREQIVHEIQQVFDGKLVWGEDLMQLTLAGPSIAKIERY